MVAVCLAGIVQPAQGKEPETIPVPTGREDMTAWRMETETDVDIETLPSGPAGLDQSQRPSGPLAYGLRTVSHRWWVPRGRAALGLAFSSHAYDATPSAMSGWTGALPPAVSFGVRYHLTSDSRIYADAMHTPHAGSGGGHASAVGIEFKADAPSLLGLDSRGKASLRLQMSSGYQMSLRLRRHGLQLVWKSRF